MGDSAPDDSANDPGEAPRDSHPRLLAPSARPGHPLSGDMSTLPSQWAISERTSGTPGRVQMESTERGTARRFVVDGVLEPHSAPIGLPQRPSFSRPFGPTVSESEAERLRSFRFPLPPSWTDQPYAATPHRSVSSAPFVQAAANAERQVERRQLTSFTADSSWTHRQSLSTPRADSSWTHRQSLSTPREILHRPSPPTLLGRGRGVSETEAESYRRLLSSFPVPPSSNSQFHSQPPPSSSAYVSFTSGAVDPYANYYGRDFGDDDPSRGLHSSPLYVPPSQPRLSHATPSQSSLDPPSRLSHDPASQPSRIPSRPPRIPSFDFSMRQHFHSNGSEYYNEIFTSFNSLRDGITLQNYSIVPPAELSTDSECEICCQQYTEEGDHRAIRLGSPGCSHVFGLSCLQRWVNSGLNSSRTCPMCRQSLDPFLSRGPTPPAAVEDATEHDGRAFRPAPDTRSRDGRGEIVRLDIQSRRRRPPGQERIRHLAQESQVGGGEIENGEARQEESDQASDERRRQQGHRRTGAVIRICFHGDEHCQCNNGGNNLGN